MEHPRKFRLGWNYVLFRSVSASPRAMPEDVVELEGMRQTIESPGAWRTR
jgi:hypothetical protein